MRIGVKLGIIFVCIIGVAIVITAVTLYFILQPHLEINLIFINNFEAYYEGAKANCTISCDCHSDDKNCIGGFPRLLSTFNEYKDMPNAVILNAGNNLRPTYTFSVNKTAELMKKFNFDAYVLGTMDFQAGLSNVNSFIKSLNPTPFITCNIITNNEPLLHGLLSKSTVITRDGFKIGIIGMLSKVKFDMEGFEKRNLNFYRIEDCVNKEAERLVKDEDVFTIILLSQCGFDHDSRIAETAHPRVSIIVSAEGNFYNGYPYEYSFSDAPYPVKIRKDTGGYLLMVTTLGLSKYLGYLKVKFSNDGNAAEWSGAPIFLGPSVVPDYKSARELSVFIKSTQSVSDKVVGRITVDLNHTNCWNSQCSIGDFVTDAMYWCKKEDRRIHDGLIAISLYPAHGIENSLKKGNITILDLRKAFPGEYYVDTGEVKGETIRRAIIESTKPHVNHSSNYFQISHGTINYYLYDRKDSNLEINTNLNVIDSIYQYQFYRVILPSALTRHRNKYFVSLKNLVKGRALINCLIEYLNQSVYTYNYTERIKVRFAPTRKNTIIKVTPTPTVSTTVNVTTTTTESPSTVSTTTQKFVLPTNDFEE